MKKAIYGLCSLAILTTLTFSTTSTLSAQTPAVNRVTVQSSEQSQPQNKISKIKINPLSITKNHSTYNCLTCGSSMNLSVKLYYSNGKTATGKDAEFICQLRTKDGTASNAVFTSKDTEISIYSPFGHEEELELIVTSAQNPDITQTYSFRTVSDARDGVAISKYTLGTTAGNVNITDTKETWNASKKIYTVTLPDVTSENPADNFIGWKDEKGNVYTAGKKVNVTKDCLHEFMAVWKEQTGVEFKVDEMPETTKYMITGKNTVSLISHTSIRKGLYTYEIPDTIEFHNKTYKVSSISKTAFSNTSVSKLVIGKNISKINANAFGKNMFLKTVIIKSKKIKSIGKNAMKNIKKEAIIKCPKSTVKPYTALLRKSGLNKKVKIKGI